MKQLRLWRPSWIYDVTQALCHIFGSNTRLYMIGGAISKTSKVVSPFLHSKSHGLFLYLHMPLHYIKKFLIHLNIFPEIPIFVNFNRSPSIHNKSKALLKSINIAIVKFPELTATSASC